MNAGASSPPAAVPVAVPAVARTVRAYAAGDEQAVLALFRDAFGHDMPPALWRWKYDRPDSRATWVEAEGQPVAFYGGVARPVLRFGQPARAVQIGDVMVAPALRGILTRHGPFYQAATGFIDRWMEGAERNYDFAFGFPSERACRLGMALKLYEPMDRILELDWAARPAARFALTVARPLGADQGDEVDRLWARMARHLTGVVAGVRDFTYIRSRYLTHPVHRYEVLLAVHRLTRHARGLLVLRDHGDHGLELMDLVGPPETLPTLVDLARNEAARLGRARVFAWATPVVAQALRRAAGAERPSEVLVPAIVWKQPEAVRELEACWWLMGGDADFR